MIFFDIDGTLIDHDSAETAAALAFQQVHPQVFPEPPQAFVARWKEVSWRHVKRWLAGETTFQGQRRSRLQELFSHHRQLTNAQADDLIQHYVDAYEQNWRLYDDVQPCLQALASRRLGIISNGDSGQQRQKLEKLKIAGLFSVITISGDVGLSKPAAGIFAAACAAAGLAMQQCTYIGNHLDSDILAGTRAGMRAIWINRLRLPCPLGVVAIRSLVEMPGVIGSS